MSCSGDDIERIGKARYAELRPQLEVNHWGKIVVIDVHSGDYEIGDDDWNTTLRLFERRPDAMTWGERVGYPAIYYMSVRPQFLPLGSNGTALD